MNHKEYIICYKYYHPRRLEVYISYPSPGESCNQPSVLLSESSSPRHLIALRSCGDGPFDKNNNNLLSHIPAPHLTHEGWYHPVEDGVPESKPFFSGAENSEVFCRLGDNMGEKLYGDRAQRFPVGRHFEEYSGVSVSGVLLNSGHLRRGTWGVAAGLAHAALTSAESFLEGFGYLSGFELGCELLHHTVAIWENTLPFNIHENKNDDQTARHM